MAVWVLWVDPFTGQVVDTPTAPLGGTNPAIPEGYAIYQGNPSDLGGLANTIYTAPGGATPYITGDYSMSGGYSFESTRAGSDIFYFDGDQWAILQKYEDIESLQSALEAIGALGGDYMRGERDDKTAAALSKVLAAANASGLSWEQVLTRGLERASEVAARRGGGGGGGGGGGAAAVSDDDIKAIGNKVAQGVLGRNLRDDEIANFIPAFRGTIGGGTSPAVAAENVVRQSNPAETYAHDVGNAMQMVSKMLGGLP